MEHDPEPTTSRKARIPRACTSRARHAVAPSAPPPRPERRCSARKDKEDGSGQQCGRVITPLVSEPAPAELLRFQLRSRWELASVLNFLNVFRSLLKIQVEFTSEELETALLTPNSLLANVHMPLLKVIPPITRMALGHATWVTVLCRKLKVWWHWVAEGDIPVIASHGLEFETYKNLDPATRVLILKAICDIRVEQEDIRKYIDGSLKRGAYLSLFRKERIGGDSYGISYWYEDDPILGYRLYREIRHVETKAKKSKGKAVSSIVTYQWETVATNFDEFQEVSERLFSSTNRTEVSLGKKLKIDYLPDIERTHRRKEKLLKKQQKEALLLDSYLTADGLQAGRALRDRKPVTYTFDDYDRSINEAIKITKKRPSFPENSIRRAIPKHEHEGMTNGKWNGPQSMPNDSSDMQSQSPTPNPSNDYEESNSGQESEPLDRSNRRRKRPQRYMEDFVSDADANVDSDDDIVGEAVYDEEYLRNRKQRRNSSCSEGDDDDEFRLEEAVDEEYDEEGEDDDEEEYSVSTSADFEDDHASKKLPARSKRSVKLKSVNELQTGLRRSKRARRQNVDYQQFELSETDEDSRKHNKSRRASPDSDGEDDLEQLPMSSQSQDNESTSGTGEDRANSECDNENKDEVRISDEMNSPSPASGAARKCLLDLNELAPDGSFVDEPKLNLRDGDNMDNNV